MCEEGRARQNDCVETIGDTMTLVNVLDNDGEWMINSGREDLQALCLRSSSIVNEQKIKPRRLDSTHAGLKSSMVKVVYDFRIMAIPEVEIEPSG